MRNFSPRLGRPYVAASHDLIMAAIAFIASLYLRLGPEFWDQVQGFIVESTLIFTVICGIVFARMHLYRGIWHYASLDDFLAITKAVSLAILIFSLAMFVLTRLESIPRSILVITWLLLVTLLGGPRLFYRVIKDRGTFGLFESGSANRIPVIVVGTDDVADAFLRQQKKPGEQYRVLGLIGTDRSTVGRYIHGIPILGDMEHLEAVLSGFKKNSVRPQRILIAGTRIAGAKIRGLLELADSQGMTLARLPRLTDFKIENSTITEPRPIAIEDLLGRPQSRLDRAAMGSLIRGRRVLITGAGGSIGSELSRQVAAKNPKRLTLLDHGEYNLYCIEKEIADQNPSMDKCAVLGDVRDMDLLSKLFQTDAPELVFHAAALKHVPLGESNPCEAILTNIQGTRNVADACKIFHADAMVLISTDKAVKPSSIMGATKWLAENYCQALDKVEPDHRTRFMTVRFGNVLGSTGSVVPLFQQQLASGGPLTVTHPDMERYFMTVREAVELVLQASVLALEPRRQLGDPSDAPGNLYVLDMGEPIRIQDLAKQIIRLSGLTPEEDISIKYIGLRGGEKLSEELFHDWESLVPTEHEAIRLAVTRPATLAQLEIDLSRLTSLASARNQESALRLLIELVPEFQRTHTSEVQP
jgi:FlaA1/EpsC-like NDP-sugar epimerase